jgi:peptidoglycan-associated lipoprotein
MAFIRKFRWSFLSVSTLCLVVALASCSKKDVKSDEGGVAGSAGATADAPAAPEEKPAAAPVGSTEGAGNAGEASTDLKTVQFAFDSYALDGTARGVLKTNAKWLKDNGAATVQIEGHCDERGTTEYNLALGERRANAARTYLQKLGIDKSRISVISYGKERPVDPGHDESAWARNRRDAFVTLSK